MERRPLGTSGLEVTPLGIGTRSMGGDIDEWGHADDRESVAAIHQAIDGGVNLIDTAPDFGQGHAESVVGKAIRGRRDSVIIATKCGLIPPQDGERRTRRSLSHDSILRECDESLRRLRIDAIDVYSCHRPDPDTPLRETMEAMTELLDQGKIKAIGLTNFGCERVSHAREFGPVHVIQMPFSLLRMQPADELIPLGHQHEIAVWGCSPLAKGLLAGHYDMETRFGGARERDPEFRGNQYQRNLRLIDQLRPIAERHGKTMSQLAINWVVTHPGVTSIIVGVKRPSQMLENAGALGWTIPEDDRSLIQRLLRGDLE